MFFEKDPDVRSHFPILRRFRHYWILPLISCCTWWGMLIAMMAIWAANGYGNHLYPSQESGTRMPYISDIGASGVKALFIACAATQGVFFVLSIAAERYLRHAHRLEPNRYRAEKILGGLAIFFAFGGEIGVIFLSIFDTYHHHSAHIINLCIFVVLLGISAICTSAEYTLLRKKYYEVHWLRFSYILKIVWFLVALGLAIAFAVLNGDSYDPDYGAYVEWTLSYWYGIYGIILFFDLLPASRKSQLREKSGGYMFGAAPGPAVADATEDPNALQDRTAATPRLDNGSSDDETRVGQAYLDEEAAYKPNPRTGGGLAANF
ncbi:Frag1/DRAM/Sfk1 family-domain-containing protein [Myxozyma melibiosi]|uniref:Frag1/DRAM/Sfk1 family-domain-containing protein n=1 Tax=Myxozyma melibiosi TaxID=54550 RepID=A0ABR1F1H1_9ASCO